MHETPKGGPISHTPQGAVQFSPRLAGLSRPFLCVEYVPGEDGRPRPAVTVTQCPLAVGGEPCVVSRHHLRKRKTGPEYSLWVMACATHVEAGRRSFFYPLPTGLCALCPPAVGESGSVGGDR